MTTLRNYANNGARHNEDDHPLRRLSPMWAMVKNFARVVEYRNHRFQNRIRDLSRRDSLDMGHFKHHMVRLHPTLARYDWAQPVGRFPLLPTIRDTFITVGSCEAAAVRVIYYFLGGEARAVHAQ